MDQSPASQIGLHVPRMYRVAYRLLADADKAHDVVQEACGKAEVRYAVAADGDSRQHVLASLAGQRRLGLAETSLGQLALGDRILNVKAAAWALRQEKK